MSRGLVLGALALCSVVGVACSSASSGGSGTSGDGGGSSSGGGSGGGGSLYQRLGGHDGIHGALAAIVKAELMDPDIASFFFNQVASPVPAGHPTADQIEECLTDQLGNAAGGPEQYPTTVTTEAGSFTCRDMMTIHASFHISGGTFDKFVMIAAGVLQSAGVSQADIATIGMVLTGQRPAIVDPALADAGEQSFDAGAD